MDVKTQVEFIAGASIRVIVIVKDDDKALVDPTSVLVTLTDPDGTDQVDQNEIVVDGKISTGLFEQYYNTSGSSVTGWWQGKIEVVDGSGDTARTSIATFSVNVK